MSRRHAEFVHAGGEYHVLEEVGTLFVDDRDRAPEGRKEVQVRDEQAPRAIGLATRRNALIERGVLQGFLHNSYTARRLGTVSTGSAVRGFKSTPSAGAPKCPPMRIQLAAAFTTLAATSANITGRTLFIACR